MAYNVITSSRAKMDMLEIAKYIATELYAPEAANNLLDDFENQMADLTHMPKKFTLVSDERLARLGIRSVPVKNYIIFYVVSEHVSTVTIISVMYCRRDWANLL